MIIRTEGLQHRQNSVQAHDCGEEEAPEHRHYREMMQFPNLKINCEVHLTRKPKPKAKALTIVINPKSKLHIQFSSQRK